VKFWCSLREEEQEEVRYIVHRKEKKGNFATCTHHI